ncbi:MAG: hypothetical protein JO279_04930, partial [Verrucomicrobia bacterium]|nr:hypothetical protein [Verrucomicrobiota bacterium]
MMNSIRPDALASLHHSGEAKHGNRPRKRERPFRDLSLEGAVSSKIGMHGVVGDRMVRSWSDINCADLNPTLKGWYEYFKHSAPHVFKGIDGYVRGRLRSILRRQTKRKGRAR